MKKLVEAYAVIDTGGFKIDICDLSLRDDTGEKYPVRSWGIFTTKEDAQTAMGIAAAKGSLKETTRIVPVSIIYDL